MKAQNSKRNKRGYQIIKGIFFFFFLEYLRHEMIEYFVRFIEYLFQ